MNWKENFEEGQELVLATCSSQGKPNANVVISLGFLEGKLLIADCQMRTTISNMQENNKIAVIGKYCRILGTVEIFTSGQYFDKCVEKSKEYKVKNAIVIDIKEVFDLDKIEKIIQ